MKSRVAQGVFLNLMSPLAFTSRTDELAGLTRAVMNNYILKLYISGSSPRAQAAIANLKRICEEDLAGRYTLEIIDVLKNPDAAELDKVLATPTLVKQLPPPLRRVIGDLSDKDKVLLGLEVHPRRSDAPEPPRK